jgi:hypothetical protein
VVEDFTPHQMGTADRQKFSQKHRWGSTQNVFWCDCLCSEHVLVVVGWGRLQQSKARVCAVPPPRTALLSLHYLRVDFSSLSWWSAQSAAKGSPNHCLSFDIRLI